MTIIPALDLSPANEVEIPHVPANMNQPRPFGARYWFWIEPRPFPGDILRQVAARHGMTLDEIRCASRKPKYVLARHEAMWELRRKTRLSYPRIARLLGRSDHTTAIHGVLAHEARMAERRAA